MDADAPSRATLGVTSRSPQRRWLAGAVLLAALTVAHGVWVVAHVASPMPFEDQWDFLSQLAGGDGRLDWSALWAPHNEHRIVTVRLLLLADVALTGGRSASVVLLHGLLLALLAWAIAACAGLARQERFLLACLCFALLLSAADSIPVTEPMSIGFTVTLLGVVGAVRSAESARFGTLAALACAGLASVTAANGLLVWPLLLAVAIVRGHGRAALASYSLAGAAMLSAYLWHHPLWQGAGGGMLASLGAPFALLRFVALFLAGPVGQVNAELGRVWGVLLLLATFILAWRFARGARFGKTWSRGRVVLLSLALFLIGSALLAALMRLDATPRPPRYSAMAITFNLCVIALWAAETRPILLRVAPPKLAAFFAAVTILATLAYAPRQAREAEERHARLAAASAVLRQDLRTDKAFRTLAAIAPDPARIWQIRPFLVARKLTIFAVP